VLLAVSAPVDWLPEVVVVPDHAPEREQEVAFVDDQVSIEELPLATDAGFAVIDTVGAGVGPGELANVAG
jgi:hypothetical protein